MSENKNKYRRDLHVVKERVEEILPDYFKSEYPELIQFLKHYYETLKTDDGTGYCDRIEDLKNSRDLFELDEYLFKELMVELTNGVDISALLTDSRLKGFLLADYYRKKGTIEGIEQFFRWLLNEDVEVRYTKKDVFRVYNTNEPETMESKIGPKSLHYLKDDKLYQTYALLIKSGYPVSKWRDLYKEYAHPAGFYFEGQVVIESIGDLNLGAMPINIPIDFISIESFTGNTEVSNFDISGSSSITGIFEDSQLD